MGTAFQADAFQVTAFQISAGIAFPDNIIVATLRCDASRRSLACDATDLTVTCDAPIRSLEFIG